MEQRPGLGLVLLADLVPEDVLALLFARLYWNLFTFLLRHLFAVFRGNSIQADLGWQINICHFKKFIEIVLLSKVKSGTAMQIDFLPLLAHFYRYLLGQF